MGCTGELCQGKGGRVLVRETRCVQGREETCKGKGWCKGETGMYKGKEISGKEGQLGEK